MSASTPKRRCRLVSREVSPPTNTFQTLGLEFKPISNIVVKADYQCLTNPAGSGQNQFNLALGYAF